MAILPEHNVGQVCRLHSVIYMQDPEQLRNLMELRQQKRDLVQMLHGKSSKWFDIVAKKRFFKLHKSQLWLIMVQIFRVSCYIIPY